MPLNLVSDNDFVPFLKYNAKAGRFYVRPAAATDEVEIINPRLAIDMANIRTGWIHYPQEGSGPEKIWDVSLAEAAERPLGPKKFRRGFEVMVYGADKIPGVGPLGLREWSSNAGNANAAIIKMYEAYEQAAGANPGKVPVYLCGGVIPITGAYGVNYEPKFALTTWVDRTRVPAFDDFMGKQAAKLSPTKTATTMPIGNEGKTKPAFGDDGLGDEIPF